jgi:hypothetical protein
MRARTENNQEFGATAFVKWASGFVRRWHVNAVMSRYDDYVCAHQGRCGQLVIDIFPDHSLNLLRAAVTHDMGEFVVGDLPAPFKRVGGAVVQQHAEIECRVRRAYQVDFGLTDDDERRLKFIDGLDAYLFVCLREPREITRSGWPNVRLWLERVAHELGVSAVLSELMHDAGAVDFS